MKHNWFEYNGKKSTDFGLIMMSGRTPGSPERDVDFHAVPGRNGDLIVDNGRFTNFEDTYECALKLKPGMTIEQQAKKIKSWLQSSFKYEKLRDYNDPEYYRMAVCVNKIDLEKTLAKYGFAIIIFNCKPFKYSLIGLEPITITGKTTLFNPESYSSLPSIKVFGSGDITIYINNQAINLKGVEDYIVVDAEMQNAYKGTFPQNDKLRSEFPIFEPGENIISWNGNVERLEIVPRWVTLA